ncbi:MAG: acyl-CoA desaturase [Planctomycetes bacterium]|nr:acyl-CoA desaturase [Planctomycetota bacterium]
MSSTRFHFTGRAKTPFARELRGAVESYFATRGISPHANAAMVAKSLAMLGLLAVPYALVMSGAVSGLLALLACALMGGAIAGIGFGIGHDALHGAYATRPLWNRVLSFSFELIGANRSFWQLTHNRAHHSFTNVDGADLDLRVADPLVRLSPHSPRLAHHRAQHLYAWPLYALTTLNWVFVKDYQYLFAPRFRSQLGSQLGRTEIALLFAGKALHYGWSLVLPLALLDLPLGQILLGYLVMHLVAGTLLSVVFQLAHVIEDLPVVTPDERGAIAEEWWAHQLRTTSNFATRSRWLSWFTGGLNHQVEHHLFPRICSVHYPALAPIVAATARKHGLPYREHPTLGGAIASHYRRLKTLGTTNES